jgi:hypothetical protein
MATRSMLAVLLAGLVGSARGYAASTILSRTFMPNVHPVSLFRSTSVAAPLRLRMADSISVEAPGFGRRQAVLGIAAGLVTVFDPWPSYAAPVNRNTGTVRAPLPPGAADPKDWETLTSAASTVEAWGDDLDDPSSWKTIADEVQKAPFTQDSMDLMFRKAAKNLPPNALLGSDAGYWAGVRVEAMQAMDAFAVEVQYLQDESKKKGGSADPADLKTYHEDLVAKLKEFIAIKDDVRICKRCAGKTVGVAQEDGKAKEFSEEERVRFGKD